jgi:hypothetical protein
MGTLSGEGWPENLPGATRGCHAKVGAHLLWRLQESAALSAAGRPDVGIFSRAVSFKIGGPDHARSEHWEREALVPPWQQWSRGRAIEDTIKMAQILVAKEDGIYT